MVNDIEMRKILIQIVIFAMFPFLGQAQNEYMIYGGGGLLGLSYSSTAGQPKSSLGGQFGLGYCYFLNPDMGIVSGIEYALYRSKFNADVINSSHRATDIEGGAFDFHSSVSGYEETQNASFLQIPLKALYQIKNSRENRYYVAGGFKIGIPLSAKYSNTADAFKNSGYYREEIYEYTIQQFIGFGEFNNRTSKGDLDLKTVFFLSFDAGMKFKLDKSSLYVGAYFDYALNSTLEKPSRSFVEYNTPNPTAFTLNSVANSQYTLNGATTSFTDKIKPVAVGVKVMFAFGNRWE